MNLLLDWLGSGGKQVDKSLAERRSAICLNCTLNRSKGWWDKTKGLIAEVIRGQLEIKNQMGLKLSGEENLHMCGGCGCCLRLKPWVPLEHIAKHTDEETLSKFADFCWIKKELADVASTDTTAR